MEEGTLWEGDGSIYSRLKKSSEILLLSCVLLFEILWTVAQEAPLSMGFPSQEYWSGLPFPSSGNLPDPGIEPGSPALQADSLLSEPPGKPVYSRRNQWK